MQRIRELRAQGMDTAGIKAALSTEDLAGMQPPYIEAAIEPVSAPEAIQPAPLATMDAAMITATLQAIQRNYDAAAQAKDERYLALTNKVEEIEARATARYQSLVLGILIGVVITALVLALVWAGMSLR